MRSRDDPLQNDLLAALPDAEWQRWRPRLEFVEMPLGQVLAEPGAAHERVYFPTTAIVSLLSLTTNGHSAEVAIVGNDGLIGVALLMGGDAPAQRAIVQSAGQGFGLEAAFLEDEFTRSGPVRHLLLRYAQARLTQIGQTAVCNRHHSVAQQLCRWLLLCLDRAQDRHLAMTQDAIAHNLGVRREGVTEAALQLQRPGLIRYARGQIEILDRQGLEELACECYAVIRNEYTRLLPDAIAA